MLEPSAIELQINEIHLLDAAVLQRLNLPLIPNYHLSISKSTIENENFPNVILRKQVQQFSQEIDSRKHHLLKKRMVLESAIDLMSTKYSLLRRVPLKSSQWMMFSEDNSPVSLFVSKINLCCQYHEPFCIRMSSKNVTLKRRKW